MPYFRASFFVGRTGLKLTVIDNTGDKAEATTEVYVLNPVKGGNKSPVITGMSKKEGPTYGGFKVVIKGKFFYNEPKVLFGGVEARTLGVVGSGSIEVEVPPGEGAVGVIVVTGFGWSKPVNFKYVVSDDVQVKFKELVLRNSRGGIFAVKEITGIKVGPDGRYYMGSLDGFVYRLEVNKDMMVLSSCRSITVGKQRSILGLAFHPGEWNNPNLYISTSTLYWKGKPGGYGWNNGKVELWRSGAGGAKCMGHVKDVVTGLPVSAHDHGVNALEFLNNGDLLITVGSSTNAGVNSPKDKLGGISESPLSAAILLAKLSRGAKFNGHVTYDQVRDPGTAKVTSGDSVVVYSSGIRNSFGLLRHTNGKIYATTNGPNPGFGTKSVGCNKDGGDTANHGDTLILARPGSYHGHPNRNRGRFDGRQCVYHSDKEKNQGRRYSAALAGFQSSTDGILEYTANTFGFQLRGNIFTSKLSWGTGGALYRSVLTKDGFQVQGNKAEVFATVSGLSIAMSPYGDIVMPKVKQGRIVVLRPLEPMPQGPFVTAVTSRRGPRAGGNVVLITGYNFAKDIVVLFGNQRCSQLFDLRLEHDGSSVWCRVPPARGNLKVAVKVRVGKQISRSVGADYEYT